MINNCTKFVKVGIKIACLISLSTITKMISNIEGDRSFFMKSIKIEFHECLRIVLGQLDRREKYSKSPENSKFIVQEILNYILISKKF